MARVTIFLATLALVTLSCSGARILGIFGIPSVSHQVVYRALMKELAYKGHNVTIITPDPIGKPIENYHEIDVSYAYDYWRQRVNVSGDGGWILRNLPEFLLFFFMSMMTDFCEMYLSDPNISRIIDNNEQFDLYIVEFGPTMCVLPMVKEKPLIGALSLGFNTPTHTSAGSTSNTAYVPDPFLPYDTNMNTFQRLRLLVLQVFMKIYSPISMRGQHAIAEKRFGPNIPPLEEYMLNASLLMQHTHPSTSYPIPQTQVFVDIGGPPLHLWKHEPQPLPRDIQDFMDGAEHGVIYFSLGSNVKSSTMPEAKRNLFLNAFRRLKQRVLWKWETDDLPGKPDNVKVHKWLPQTDVLAHPNLRAFMTQGGLQSMGEATQFKVPLVVIPFFGDQELNAKKIENVGIGIKLSFETLTEEDIFQALNQILSDNKYKEAMIKYSDLTNDQPQAPMDRAVWWVEYVLRHNGARHLRSAAVDMPWYQYFMIDVLAFLAAIIGAVLYTLHFIASRLFRLVFRRQRKAKTE